MNVRLPVVLVLAASIGLAPSAAAGIPSLGTGLHFGSDRVGFRRLGAAESEVDVWYPAVRGGRAMRFADSIGDTAGTAGFLRHAGVPAAEVASLLDAPLAAHADAPARPGVAHPLVLVAQGNGQVAADQAVLCEFLASWGYVVTTTTSPMRWKPMEKEDQVGSFAETQCGDLAAAVGVVAAAMPADTTRLAVVGHSFGARAALLLSMRNPRVRALVSLDGGIGTATALASFRAAPSFRIDAPLPSILHFYERLDAFMTPDFTLLHELAARSLDLREVHDLHHTQFTTYGFAVSHRPGLARVTHASANTARSARSVAEETRRFLDAHVKE